MSVATTQLCSADAFTLPSQHRANKDFVQVTAEFTHTMKANAVYVPRYLSCCALCIDSISIHRDADKAADIVTDASLAMEEAQDATDVLTGTTLAGEDMFDAQADEEMAALEAELAAETAASASAAPAPAAQTTGGTPAVAAPAPAATGVTAAAAAALPQAPTHTLGSGGTVTEAAVDAELAALEAEMA